MEQQQQHHLRPQHFQPSSTSNQNLALPSSSFNKDAFFLGTAPIGTQQQLAASPFGFGSSSTLFPSGSFANPTAVSGSTAMPFSSFSSAASPFTAMNNAPSSSLPFGASTGAINSNPFGSSFASKSVETTVAPPTFGSSTGFGGASSKSLQSSGSSSAPPSIPNPFVASSNDSAAKHQFLIPSAGSLPPTAPSPFVSTTNDPESSNHDRQWVRSKEQANTENADTAKMPTTLTPSDELSRLKAKIAEKKRHLEEQKRNLLKQKVVDQMRQQQMQEETDVDNILSRKTQKKPPPQSSKHRKSTIPSKREEGPPSTIPNLKGNSVENLSIPLAPEALEPITASEEKRENDAQPKLDDKSEKAMSSKKTIQERPLFRLLPPDLQPIALTYKPPSMYDVVEEHHDNASSLVGICQTMCPTEELLRREYENDIPLLEIPHPSLHPSHWTLRETCLKRFRRSAADYKLDIPSLVRPPIVLEQCISYLEEFVMERDRQGIDPRFGKVPPSLDVYQFVWDRTRMIRKDFILQNYIGRSANNTGLCSAVAVRCHERIARWHVMMEHQLSHLPEYMAQQSVQNIQELGQTLKTLNQLYDDGRTTKPDEGDTSSRHGCQFDFVQGPNPIDYDGVELNNTKTLPTTRFIGAGTTTKNNGTAEAEMRGLYILLTMHNDGGMEVLKYAASLAAKNPVVFQSKPVQLALSVFRARKEWNYARFFQILRSTSTPYLFSCVMFKYVEEMRKVALYIMSRSYGTRRSKEDSSSVYDKYKLTDLIRLLCFEDEIEALDACRHFGITVVDSHSSAMDDDKSTSGEESFAESKKGATLSKSYQGKYIRWRYSRFHEPIDPVKGCKIPLRTRKMARTIEAKLSGATRLAVCRGDMSTYQATEIFMTTRSINKHEDETKYVKASSSPPSQHTATPSPPARRVQKLDSVSAAITQKTVEARVDEKEKRITKSIHVQNEKNSEKVENKITPLAQPFHFLPHPAIVEKKNIIFQNQPFGQVPRQSIGENKKPTVEDVRLNQFLIKQEETNRRKEQAAYITKKRLEEEEERKNLEVAKKLIEEERLKKEMEHWKQLEEEKKIAEEVLRKRLKAEEEEEEEQRIELEKLRIEKEWEHKANHAIKCLAWRLWLKAVARNHRSFFTDSINNIDPAFCSLLNICRDGSGDTRSVTEQVTPDDSVTLYKSVFRNAAKLDAYPIKVADILATRLHRSYISSSERLYVRCVRPVILFKVAIVLPLEHDDNFHPLILSWINSRIRFNEVFSQRFDASLENPAVVHFTLVHGTDDEQIFEGCDGAIFFITPGMHFSFNLFPSSSVDVPCKVAYVLENFFEAYSSIRDVMTNGLGDIDIVKVRLHPSCRREVNRGLTTCFERLIDLFLEKLKKGYRFVERISFTKLGCRCIRAVLAGNSDSLTLTDSIPNVCLKNLVFCLKHALASLQEDDENFWPAREFCCKNEQGQEYDNDQALSVPGYFGAGSDLPYTWLCQFDSDLLQKSPLSIFLNPTAKKVEDIISAARCEGVYIPFDTAQDCELFLFKRDVRSFLESLLTCFENNLVRDDFIYLPSEMVKHVFHLTLSMTNKKIRY